jgi:hypothetical protein
MRRFVYLLLYITVMMLIVPVTGLALHGLVSGMSDPARVSAFAAEKGVPTYFAWVIPILVVLWGGAAILGGAVLVRRSWKRGR